MNGIVRRSLFRKNVHPLKYSRRFAPPRENICPAKARVVGHPMRVPTRSDPLFPVIQTRRYPVILRVTSNIFLSVNSANNRSQFFVYQAIHVARTRIEYIDREKRWSSRTESRRNSSTVPIRVADFGRTQPDGIDARVAQILRAFLEEQGSISRLACLLSPLQDEPPSPRASYPPFPTYSTIRYDLYLLYRYVPPSRVFLSFSLFHSSPTFLPASGIPPTHSTSQSFLSGLLILFLANR